MKVSLPPLEELARVWDQVEPLLAKATIRTGCYEPIDLLQLAFLGRAGIWLCESERGIDAAIVTEVKQYPRRRILEVLFGGGGNMAAWLEAAVAALDAHAKEAGCSHIATVGRKGWARAWGAEFGGDVVLTRGLRDG